MMEKYAAQAKKESHAMVRGNSFDSGPLSEEGVEGNKREWNKFRKPMSFILNFSQEVEMVGRLLNSFDMSEQDSGR